MRTPREIAHKLSEGVIPACWTNLCDDGPVIHHSRYCDAATESIIEYTESIGVVFCRCRQFTLQNKPDNHFCGTNRF